MRYDAAKLLTEDGARGGTGKSNKTGIKLDPRVDWFETWDDVDTGPSRISSSRGRQYGYDGKSPGDYLKPLDRFMEKNIGKSWNDAYSEICKVADPRSMQGNHLRDHARQYLNSRYFFYSGYYIDDNGLLQYWERNHTPWVGFQNDETIIDWFIDPTKEYKKVKGSWFSYEYFTRDPDELKTYYDYKDKIYKTKKACEFIGWDPSSSDPNKTKIRQISKSEIKRLFRNHSFGLNQKHVERTGRKVYIPTVK